MSKKERTVRSKATRTRFITVTAMLSAVAFVLQYIEIPVPFMPPFIKFDFSDLPALIGAYAYGPLCGVIISLIKNVLHLPFGSTGGVGELSNFILGAAFSAVAGLVYKHKKSKASAFVGGIVGAAAMGLISIVSNYFVVYPVYYNFMPKEVIIEAYQTILSVVSSYTLPGILACLLIFNLPFTILKGLIDVVICLLIYKPLSPFMKGFED